MTNLEVRPTVGGWDHVVELLEKSFGMDWPEPERSVVGGLFEPERSLGAYVGDEIVGHSCIWSLDLRVPGRTIPVAGVTMVGVRPTHRRRGVLSTVMRRQLAELHETGAEPVAALSATEPAIYGRFGYGLASEQVAVEIPRAARTLRPVAGADQVAVRYADPDKTREQWAALHDAALSDRPGSFRLTEPWLRRLTSDPPSDRGGASVRRCVLAERAGEVTGFTHYRTRPSWDGAGPRGAVEVERVHALDLASYLALWRFLLDQDLTATTKHAGLALDDPLLTLLVDPRKANMLVNDGLWVRLADVGRALAARTYATPLDVVLEVGDELCPWNAGRWRLSGGPEGATCEPTSAAPDLALDVRELGAAYLGGRSLLRLAAAGLVEERTPGALATSSRAWTHDPLPWRDITF